MSRDINCQNERLGGRSRNFQFIGLTLALMVVVLCTAVSAAQENNAAQDKIIMAGQSDFPLPIPDDGSWLQVGTVDNLAPRNGIVQSVNLKALINHPAPEQLEMQLVKDGFSSDYLLTLPTATAAEMEGGAIKLANINFFAGAPAEGAWILRVHDPVPGRQGYLDGISVVAIYEPIGSRRVTSSSSSGKPTSFSLPADAIASSNNSPVTTDAKESLPMRAPQRISSWEVIKTEDFEGVFPSSGFSFVNQSSGGEWYWDDTSCTPSGGSGWSAWPADEGADALDACVDNYANNMKTWMIYGPFDLSDAYEADTEFSIKYAIETDYDYIYFGVSQNGTDFNGLSWDGAEDWSVKDIYYNDWTGDSSVWVAWMFSSDDSVTYTGPFVDNIIVWKNVLETPILNPIPNEDGDGNFTLIWSGVEGAQSFELQEKKDGGSWSDLDPVSSTSRSISGRGYGEWCYHVRAVTDTAYSSSWSNIKCTTVKPPPPNLNPPLNSDGDGKYTVRWSSVSGTTYELEEQKNGGSWKTIYTGSSTSRSISDRSIGDWCYHVRALSPSGNSNWSNIECTEVRLALVYLPAIFNSDTSYFEGPREQEDNDKASDANGPLRIGRTYIGHPDDERDFYTFILPSDGQFTVQLDNHIGQDTQLQLFYQTATVGNRIAFDTAAPYTISYNGQRGLYYIFIYSAGNYSSTSEYTLRVTRP